MNLVKTINNEKKNWTKKYYKKYKELKE